MVVFIVLDYDKSVGMQWIAFNANGNTATYFDSFGVEPIPEKSRNINNNNIINHIFRIQAYDSIMCG